MLGRGHFVGDPEAVEYWEATIRAMFVAEAEREDILARRNRKTDADRGIPAALTFKRANEAREKVERFDSALAEARAADEAKRAAKDEDDAPVAQTGTDS